MVVGGGGEGGGLTRALDVPQEERWGGNECQWEGHVQVEHPVPEVVRGRLHPVQGAVPTPHHVVLDEIPQGGLRSATSGLSHQPRVLRPMVL